MSESPESFKPVNETTGKQLDLLSDYGQHSRATRREALMATRSPMLEAVLNYVRKCGAAGATRDEIAMHLDRPVQSITRPVFDLRNDQAIVETPARRPTRWGRLAVVCIAREYSEML
jgi:hypothetical protein